MKIIRAIIHTEAYYFLRKIILNLVPCFFFPTETVLVDDNLIFLNNLKLELGSNFKSIVFTNPHDALTYLKNKENLQETILEKYLEETIDDASHIFKKGMIVNLSSLYELVYNADRFKLASVIVLDFAMPQMNGRDFSLALDGRSFKILMLTGEADNDVAVLLFNRGVIHKFLFKEKKDYLEKVISGILELRMKYFMEASNKFISSLGQEVLSILSDPAYIEKYKEICKEKDIIESYLLDYSGSQLFLDSKGNPFWFFIKTEDDMQMLLDFAGDDKNADKDLVKIIEKKQKLTHFFNLQDSLQTKNWKLYEAKQISGKNIYYYALISHSNDMPLEKERIISYDQYLRSGEKNH